MRYKHVFAICAYKDSPHLERCIRSLRTQIVPSHIIICTFTPSSYIDRLVRKYGLQVYVRQGESNIRNDWNFAYSMTEGRLVTIAHQGGMYHRDCSTGLLAAHKRYLDMTVFTTDHVIVKQGKPITGDATPWIKRILKMPLRFLQINDRAWLKKPAFVLGNPICCLVTTYHKAALGEPLVRSEYSLVLDWDSLVRLVEEPGRFICDERPLLYYRVHEDATAKACIRDNRRFEEEREVFRRFWPEPVADIIMGFYKRAYGECEQQYPYRMSGLLRVRLKNVGVRACCMETGKNDTILTIIAGAAGMAVLAVMVFGVLLREPLRPVPQNTRTPLMMAEVVLVFLWNLFHLTAGQGGKSGQGAGMRFRALELATGVILFTWCHHTLLPLTVPGIYMAALVLAGKQLLRLFLEESRLSAPIPFRQRTFMSLVLGSVLWTALTRLVSPTGYGGLMLWRGLAAVMTLVAVVLEILWGHGNNQVPPGAWPNGVKESADGGGRRDKTQTALITFIITMALIQADRMDIELDYDSLHYGLRSAYVLDDGKGIYENLGMINLAYTYSKGLEVLVLPLSGTPTYGFVLAFSLWCIMGILLLAANIVGRYCGREKGI